MLFFGKKKKEVVATSSTIPEDKIHVMPEKFYVSPKKNISWLMVAAIVLGVGAVGSLIAFAVYLNFSINKTKQQPVVTNVSVNTNTTNQNTGYGNTNGSLNTNQAPTSTPTLETATTTPTSTEETVEPEPDENEPPRVGSDGDGDLLSDLEEELYGTDPQNIDTDGDGYSDGNELVSGYDPTATNKTIEQGGTYTAFQATSYTMLYPPTWNIVRDSATTENDVIFRASNNEFVQILVLPNTNNMPIRQWYEEQVGNVDFATAVTIGKLVGYRHQNGQHYYLVDPNRMATIYVLTYNSAGKTEANYFLTYNVMVKSFRLK